MRAIVRFLDGGYVNVFADTIDKQDEWIMVRAGNKTVGMFDEGTVNGELVCSYKCQRQSELKEPFKPNPQRKRTAVRVIETGEVFSSICDCAAYFGTSNNNITKCIYHGETYKGMHMERMV